MTAFLEDSLCWGRGLGWISRSGCSSGWSLETLGLEPGRADSGTGGSRLARVTGVKERFAL